MIRFARLLDDLLFSPSRNAKLRLMRDYFAAAPDPDRGWAAAALTGSLGFAHATPSVIRKLVEARVDPTLFALSYDFVGDLAETTALIWPGPTDAGADPPSVAEIVTALARCPKGQVPALLAGWLDRLDAPSRWALIKLILGGLRVGVSARLAKTALAEMGGVDVAEIEEVWHGLEPPYGALFAWLETGGPPPQIDLSATFRPLMLSHAIEDQDFPSLDPALFRAEWKWDGIRVQVVSRGGQRRLYSRTGDDVGAAFPDVVQACAFEGVLDGELLVRRDEGAGGFGQGSFNELQQRLNRKKVSAKMMAEFPAFVRLYDILFDGEEDVRALGFSERRERLEQFCRTHLDGNRRFDLSPLVAFASWPELGEIRARSEERSAEGMMIKRADAPYVAGRPKGLWYKWKRDPKCVDVVLVYAQRGHGKRSSFYSDFTFAAWRGKPSGDGEELVPVTKAYFGFTDEELVQLDRWVRNHTTKKFGPVREVVPELVCEIAFEGVQKSTRHKSGVALRFPRIKRIRWDKPAIEADRVDFLSDLAE